MNEAMTTLLWGFLPLGVFNNEAVVVELLVAHLLFARSLPRRTHVRARMAAALAVMLVVGAILAYVSAPIPSPVIRSVVNFALLFLATLPAVWLVWRCDWRTAVTTGTCGYALQHIATAITVLCHMVRESSGVPWLLTWEAGEMLRIVVFAVTYMVCAVWFIRGFDVAKACVGSAASLAFLVFCVLAISLGLSSYAYAVEDVQSAATRFALRAVSLLVCVMTLQMFRELARSQHLSDEMAFMRRMNDMRTDYYELLKDSIDLTNIRYHDFKHQIARLRAMGAGSGDADDSARQEVLDELAESVGDYGSIVATGNAALDVVLTQKSLECKRKGIRLTVMMDAGCLEGVVDRDIYSLFGNALDNAIEALERVADPERRVAKLTGVRRGKLANIHLTNYYEHVARDDSGALVTTKDDTLAHGFGLKSMRMIVEGLGGDMTTIADDGIFDLNIVLPVAR